MTYFGRIVVSACTTGNVSSMGIGLAWHHSGAGGAHGWAGGAVNPTGPSMPYAGRLTPPPSIFQCRQWVATHALTPV